MPTDLAHAVAPAPVAAPAPASKVDELALERLAREVRAVCPPALLDYAQQLMLEHGASFEGIRAKLLAKLTEQSAPVGTPAPAPIVTTAKIAAPEVKPADVDGEALIRSVCNPRMM